jgi:hypothetical protein
VLEGQLLGAVGLGLGSLLEGDADLAYGRRVDGPTIWQFSHGDGNDLERRVANPAETLLDEPRSKAYWVLSLLSFSGGSDAYNSWASS